MNKIIHRIIKYQKIGRQSFDLHKVREPEVNDYILFSCIDKRIIPNDFTKVPVGHLYVVRNAGNFVPPYNRGSHEISSEAGAIELAVKRAGIKDIIISGHSDCRDVNGLISHVVQGHAIGDPVAFVCVPLSRVDNSYLFDLFISWAMEYLSNSNKPDTEECKSHGPLSQWVKKFGRESWVKFQMFLKNPKHPLKFQLKPPPTPPDLAYFDDKFPKLDILSQINCLQQSENVATFPFLRSELLDNSLKIHTLWKELNAVGEDPTLFLFDINKEKFLKITEEYSEELTKDLD